MILIWILQWTINKETSERKNCFSKIGLGTMINWYGNSFKIGQSEKRISCHLLINHWTIEEWIEVHYHFLRAFLFYTLRIRISQRALVNHQREENSGERAKNEGLPNQDCIQSNLLYLSHRTKKFLNYWCDAILLLFCYGKIFLY